MLLFLNIKKTSAQTQTENIPTIPLTITGTITDTVNFINTGYAAVSLLRSSDSVLQTFSRTDEQGFFTLKVDSNKHYLLLISHPSFATYVEDIDISQPNTDLGTIIMTSKKQMLSEVVITDSRAIVVKGDTIEYKADSFQTRAFDNVDELLKKLPGIEIGKDGKIKAYGQEVKKMTVDGEEFFSDDPAIVSKTLRASAIDKVQVFDKKSDQAAFTGIEDGERTKTINLQLKEDAKRGYFGKIALGGGLPGYWENQAMINAFSKKRKIAAYGIMSNTNSNGLGWEDRGKFGGMSNSWSEGDDGNWVMEGATDLDLGGWDGQFSGQGLPRTWTGGVMYSNKWLNDSLSLNANYKFGKMITEADNNSISQYILPDTQYSTINNQNTTNIGTQNAVYMDSKYLIDSSSSLKVSIQAKTSETNVTSNASFQSLASNNDLINDNLSNQQTNTKNKTVDAKIDYNKKFRQKGRTFTATLSGNWKDANGTGILQSNYNLYALDSAYSLNQSKTNTSNSLTGNLKTAYTQPLSEKIFLNFNYKLGLNKNSLENNSYDRTYTGGQYQDIYNPTFSSNYDFNNIQNYGGAGMRFDYKKIKFGFTANIANTHFTQKDLLFDTTYNYSYFNVLPTAYFRYSRSQTSNLAFRYNTSFKPPSIAQLQPLRNNNDPLNIIIGNPSLSPSYNHRFNVNFNDYKMLKSRSIYLNFDANFIQNAISEKTNIDISARKVTEFVNVDGNYNLNLNTGYSRKLVGKFNSGIYLGTNYSHNNNFINGLANVNNQSTISPNIDINYSGDTTFSFDINFTPAYNITTSSIGQTSATKYWTFEQGFNGNYNLPHNFSIGTSIDWNIRQRVNEQDKNNNVFLWNAYIQKDFLKDKSLQAKLSANDILNQNKGYQRYNTATFISEQNYNVIQRYFMLSIIWNFTKSGADKAPGGDGINFITE